MAIAAPHFLLEHSRDWPALAADVLSNAPAGAVVAAGAALAPDPAARARTLAASLRPAAYYMTLDPETFRLEDPPHLRRATAYWPYLREPDPIANAAMWVPQVIQAQLQAAPTAVVSPWLTFGREAALGQPPGAHLRATATFSQLAQAATPAGTDLLIGAAITEEFLVDPTSRAAFASMLQRTPAGPIYLRVRARSGPTYRQYQMLHPLEGLISLVKDLASNGRTTIVAQAGLAGLLALSAGALGISSGPHYTQQRHATKQQGGGGGAAIPRYFVPALLAFVLQSERALLSGVPGYQPCTCSFCQRMGAGWSRELAAGHYLWWCAELTRQVTAAGGVAARENLLRQLLNGAIAATTAARQAGIRVNWHTRNWQKLL